MTTSAARKKARSAKATAKPAGKKAARPGHRSGPKLKLLDTNGAALAKLPYKLPSNYAIGFAEVSALVPYARNARMHSDAQVAMIRASIREYGWTYPVLCDSTGEIIAGHGRVLAASAEGFPVVPVIVLDHLTEGQKRALRIADNKHSANATWDWQLLADEMKELADLEPDIGFEAMGFDDQDSKLLLAGDFTPPPVDPDRHRDGAKGSGENKGITCSPEEHRDIMGAVQKYRAMKEDYDSSDGAALRGLCREWETECGAEPDAR